MLRALALIAAVALAGCQAVAPVPSLVSALVEEQVVAEPHGNEVSWRPPAKVTPAKPVSFDEPLPPPNAEQLPPPVATDPDASAPLTLEQLQGMAVASHPAIAQAAARVEALRGKLVQVGLPPNLVAGYALSEAGNDGKAGQQGAYLGQEFITGGKLALNRQVVCWEIQQAEHQLQAAERRVLTDVQLAYFDVLLAQKRVALAGELVKISAQAAKNVEALVKAQEQSQVDLLQAQIEAENAQILAGNAEAAHRGAWRNLAPLLSDPDLPLGAVAGDPAADLPRIVLAEVTARVMAEHPELAAAWADVQRARWQVDREIAQITPNVDVQLLLQHDNATSDDILGLQATMPLPIVNRNQGGIRQAEAEAVAAGHAVRRLELSLRQKLAATFRRYEMAEQQVARYTREILPRSEKSLDLTRQAYNAGEFNFLQLLTAQRIYFQAHLASLDALAELRAAASQLEGLLLSDSLEK